MGKGKNREKEEGGVDMREKKWKEGEKRRKDSE